MAMKYRFFQGRAPEFAENTMDTIGYKQAEIDQMMGSYWNAASCQTYFARRVSFLTVNFSIKSGLTR